MPVTVAGIPSMHICLDFICELVNQPQLEKQVCKNCFSRFSDSITTKQDCEQSFLFLRPVRRVDWFTSMQIFPRLGCLAAQLVRIAVACARLYLAVKKDAKNARGLGRERATTLFPRSRAFYIRLASFIFTTSIAFPLSENLAQAHIAGEGFSIISTSYILFLSCCSYLQYSSLHIFAFNSLSPRRWVWLGTFSVASVLSWLHSLLANV